MEYIKKRSETTELNSNTIRIVEVKITSNRPISDKEIDDLFKETKKISFFGIN